MTTYVKSKIESVERPIMPVVAILAIFMLVVIYSIFINGAIQSAARGGEIHNLVADLYSEVSVLESSYATSSNALGIEDAIALGYVKPSKVHYVNTNNSGISLLTKSVQ